MINPNIADNEGIYRSQIREFFEGKFGAFRDEGHYITELKEFRNTYVPSEENGYTTLGNYGSFDNVYATKRDVIIGFIEYWLTGGYQKYNRHNKYIINNEFVICDETNFSTIYDDIIDSFDATELKQIATQEFAKKIVLPNWLKITSTRWKFVANTIDNTLITLEYSTDGITWTTLPNDTTITVSAYIRGDNTRIKDINTSVGIGTFLAVAQSVQFTPPYTISGSVQSLIYGDDTENQYIACEHCFEGLFNSLCENATSKLLPAIYLKPYCYCKMFLSSALDVVPDLPATTLAERCYMRMFENCTGLTSINPLPATTLAPYCYEQMFYGCSWINFQQDVMYLPATKMERGCYLKMFNWCTHMVQAPMLPAYSLARECYMGMFGKCTNLKYAPELPALELKEQCYDTMFIDCTSLEIAPELPAKFLPQQAYSWMFCRCTSLRYIKMLFTELTEGDNYALSDYGVVLDDPTIWHNSIRGILYNNRLTNGTIILNTDYLESLSNVQLIIKNNVGDDGGVKNSPLRFVPSQWTICGSRNYLRFKPTPSTTSVTNCQSWKLIINKAKFNNGNPTYSNGTFLELVIHGSQEGYDIVYDRSTNTFEYYEGLMVEPDEDTGEISYSFGSEGICIKENYYNYENRNIEYDTRWYNRSIDDIDGHQHFRFVPQDNSTDTQYIDMFGDLRSLYYPHETFDTYDELPNNSYNKYWYDWSRYSYMFMFNTYLRHVYASVNVKEFTANMFEAAFYGCTNLIYLPNFGTNPLIPLNYATFNATFSGCTSLEYVSELPYLTYSDEDYTCGNTTEGYEISGNFYTEPTGCYSQMFYGCNNIKFIPNIFPLRYLCGGIYNNMFNMWSNNANLRKSEFKKMPEVIGVTGVANCLGIMFAYCDLREVQCIPLTTITGEPYTDRTLWAMFTYNQNLKTAMHILPLTTLKTNTYLGMFEDCRKLAVAPKIQAKTVDTDCMKWSFLRCYNLKYTNTSVTSSTTTPFNNTGSDTLKEYSTNWENEDKNGLLWIDNGQFSGLSRGYYKAALLSYSKYNNQNPYEFDGSYWIYIMTRKFADGKTYYVWKKYQSNEGIGMGDITHDLYLVTQECIIPGCIITSISQATSTTNPTPLYTIIGYMSVDFLSNINDARSGVESDNSEEDQYFDEGIWVNTNLGKKVYCKVLLSVTEQPQPD